MQTRLASRYTLLLSISALVFAVIVVLTGTSGILNERVSLVVADFGGLAVIGLAAVVVLRTSFGMGRAGRPWVFMGLATLTYLGGDIVWTIIEAVQGREVPYPGVPDAFYLGAYPLFACGLAFAALAYRGLIPLRSSFISASAVGAALSIALYFLVLKTDILGQGLSASEAFVSAAYPLGDVLLMLTPALFVTFAVGKLGGGRFAAPWRAVAAGTLVLALADIVYVISSATGTYESGAWTELGWNVGFILIMAGALLARDLTRPAAKTA